MKIVTFDGMIVIYEVIRGRMMQEVKIDHYTLGKTIGTGGFAKVKRAKHDLTGIEVAVKIINKKKMKNKNMISKVKRQIRILKFTNHPNVIKLYEVLDTTNDIFVIMQLATKGELYQNIHSTTIDEHKARFYFRQIISGLEYIHQNHITHRDLKPENILIDQNDLIKIGDFGLSNLMKDGKLLKTSCGSPSYAAPQIVGERKYQGTSVDIWSCGVILYALLVKSLPFDQDNITLLYKKIQQGAYTIPKEINPLAKDLISRMLQVDPRNRIKITEIKTHPWITFHLPIYEKITDQFLIEKSHEPVLDEGIFQRIRRMNINFCQFPEETIKKSIIKREDHSFVIAYELLKTDHDRKVYVQEQANMNDIGNGIFTKIANQDLPILTQKIAEQDEKYLYGRTFKMSIKPLIEKILKLFTDMSIKYSIKSPEYCLKCSYYHQQKSKKNGMEMEGEEQKFSKKYFKFTLQIFEVQKVEKAHVVDLQLTQGHPLVFFSIAKTIYNRLNDFSI